MAQSGEYKALELSAAKCADEELRALVVRCQSLDPAARPSFEEINRVLQSKDDSYTISQLMRGLTSKKRLLDDILPPKVGPKGTQPSARRLCGVFWLEELKEPLIGLCLPVAHETSTP